MPSDAQPFEKTWSRTSLIHKLTGAKVQIFASASVGLLVWADIITVKIPLYFFYEAALIAKEAASLAAAEAVRIVPDIFDHFENNKFTIADTANIMVTIGVFYMTYRFFRRIWRALKKMRPAHWDIWPRFGLRSKLLLASLLAAGIMATWRLGAFPWIGSQFLELGRLAFNQLSLQNLYNIGQRLLQGFAAVYENRGTVFPAAKGVLAALATYATLEVARVMADLALPAVRLGHAVYGRAYPWLTRVELSPRQRDWLHGTGSVTGGLIFGFTYLSFPPIPAWGWVALAPGLFLFLKERPNLTSAVSKASLKLGQGSRRAAEFTLSEPKWVGGIVAGFMIGTVAAGYLFSSHPFLGFKIISGAIRAAYTGASIALLIAAGRGLVSLAVHTRRIAGQMSVRAGEVWRGMLSAAATIAEPVLKLGKATITLASRAKTGDDQTAIDSRHDTHARVQSDCSQLTG
jgi:hypothetical protein